MTLSCLKLFWLCKKTCRIRIQSRVCFQQLISRSTDISVLPIWACSSLHLISLLTSVLTFSHPPICSLFTFLQLSAVASWTHPLFSLNHSCPHLRNPSRTINLQTKDYGMCLWTCALTLTSCKYEQSSQINSYHLWPTQADPCII